MEVFLQGKGNCYLVAKLLTVTLSSPEKMEQKIMDN